MKEYPCKKIEHPPYPWNSINFPGDPILANVARADDSSAVRRNGQRRYSFIRIGALRAKSGQDGVCRCDAQVQESGEYLVSELHAAVANALITPYQYLESDLDPASVAELFGTDQSEATSYCKTVSEKWNRKKMKSGLMFTVLVGIKLSSHNTSRPKVVFEGFIEAVMRHMAVGIRQKVICPVR